MSRSARKEGLLAKRNMHFGQGTRPVARGTQESCCSGSWRVPRASRCSSCDRCCPCRCGTNRRSWCSGRCFRPQPFSRRLSGWRNAIYVWFIAHANICCFFLRLSERRSLLEVALQMHPSSGWMAIAQSTIGCSIIRKLLRYQTNVFNY